MAVLQQLVQRAVLTLAGSPCSPLPSPGLDSSLGGEKMIINVQLTLTDPVTVLGLGTVQVNKTIILPLQSIFRSRNKQNFLIQEPRTVLKTRHEGYSR